MHWVRPPTPSMPFGSRTPCQWTCVLGSLLVTKIRTLSPSTGHAGPGLWRCSPKFAYTGRLADDGLSDEMKFLDAVHPLNGDQPLRSRRAVDGPLPVAAAAASGFGLRGRLWAACGLRLDTSGAETWRPPKRTVDVWAGRFLSAWPFAAHQHQPPSRRDASLFWSESAGPIKGIDVVGTSRASIRVRHADQDTAVAEVSSAVPARKG
jgi:hypothetical protein